MQQEIEQRKIDLDTGLIALLCDAARLGCEVINDKKGMLQRLGQEIETRNKPAATPIPSIGKRVTEKED